MKTFTAIALFSGLMAFLSAMMGYGIGMQVGATQALKQYCLVPRLDLAALTNERLDTRIQTLHDALEYTITVRMTRAMDERDRLEAERTGLEVELYGLDHAPIPD